MTIQDPKMISAIIDHLDLPISKRAEELRYYGSGKAFFCYNVYRPNEESVQIDLSIDAHIGYWGNIEIEVFSSIRPITTLLLTSDNFYVSCGYNWKGRLQHDDFYISSLD